MERAPIPSPRELELLALAVKERFGREVARHYEALTGRRIPLGTVYTVYGKMEAKVWVQTRIERVAGRDHKFFQTTDLGRAVLAAGRHYYGRLASFDSALPLGDLPS